MLLGGVLCSTLVSSRNAAPFPLGSVGTTYLFQVATEGEVRDQGINSDATDTDDTETDAGAQSPGAGPKGEGPAPQFHSAEDYRSTCRRLPKALPAEDPEAGDKLREIFNMTGGGRRRRHDLPRGGDPRAGGVLSLPLRGGCQARGRDRHIGIPARLLQAMLVEAFEADHAAVEAIAPGVPIGVGVRLPRTPAIYPRRRKWRLEGQDDADMRGTLAWSTVGNATTVQVRRARFHRRDRRWRLHRIRAACGPPAPWHEAWQVTNPCARH